MLISIPTYYGIVLGPAAFRLSRHHVDICAAKIALIFASTKDFFRRRKHAHPLASADINIDGARRVSALLDSETQLSPFPCPPN